MSDELPPELPSDLPPPAPPAPPPPGEPGEPLIPWEERGQRGWFEALVETIRLTATDPAEAFRRLRADGDYLSPLIYGVILGVIGIFFSQFWSLMLGSVMESMMGDFGGASFGGTIGSLILALVLGPILYPIILFVVAALYHLFLLVLGAMERSPHGFEGTFKVLAYSSITQLANIVPIVGGLIGLVWMIYLLTVGFSTVHKTTQGKALIAALLPVLLCCVCGMILAVLFFGGVAAMIGASAG